MTARHRRGHWPSPRRHSLRDAVSNACSSTVPGRAAHTAERTTPTLAARGIGSLWHSGRAAAWRCVQNRLGAKPVPSACQHRLCCADSASWSMPHCQPTATWSLPIGGTAMSAVAPKRFAILLSAAPASERSHWALDAALAAAALDQAVTLILTDDALLHLAPHRGRRNCAHRFRRATSLRHRRDPCQHCRLGGTGAHRRATARRLGGHMAGR